MNNKRKLAIIGHFGGKESLLDGQTVKTKILYEELSKATDWKIIKVDTYYKNRKPVILMLNTLGVLLSTRDVIVLLSGNGMKFYFPLLYVFSKVFHTRVYHDVIGGNLDSYVEKIPKFRKYLNEFRVNWVETNGLKQKLESRGVNNCEVIPNFKRLSCVKCNELKAPKDKPYRFCTFSRVMKEKGIEDAIKAVQAINQEKEEVVCTLDIYGLIDEEYKVQFKKILEEVPDAIKYCGKVSYEESVETIRGYYALLFPTFWRGEGFPGTIIDAFSAGLPVITTNWSCNSEIIEDGKNGILYPNTEIKDLKSAIEYLISNPERIMEMKKCCICSAEKYQPDDYIRKIVEYVREK